MVHVKINLKVAFGMNVTSDKRPNSHKKTKTKNMKFH